MVKHLILIFALLLIVGCAKDFKVTGVDSLLSVAAEGSAIPYPVSGSGSAGADAGSIRVHAPNGCVYLLASISTEKVPALTILTVSAVGDAPLELCFEEMGGYVFGE